MDKRESIRKIEIRNLSLMIFITLIIGLTATIFYLTRDNYFYVNYKEKSDVDYKVHLAENEFYKEEYIGKDSGYIASLIEKIDTRFYYNMEFDKKITYKYSYNIVADVEVMDDTVKSSLYHYSEELKKVDLSSSMGDLVINDSIDIDYAKYNNLISKFKEVYELNNTTSTLNVYLMVNVQDIDKSNSTSLMNKKVSSISIPLTEKTVAIEIGNNTINDNDSKLEISRHRNYTWALIVGLFYLVISLVYAIYLIIYMEKSKTAQMIYDKEMKSILSNYEGYIQKINGSYDIGTSQVLKIESFNDMLEIRDTLKQPILMLENAAKDGAFFIIPATNSIIYTYALRVVDIKAKMDGKAIPTYDITEIASKEFLKKKKYTEKYITDQITMTTSMPVIDEKNIIKGSADKKKDLYDQLEMTQSFDIREIKKAEKELKKKTKKTTKKTK